MKRIAAVLAAILFLSLLVFPAEARKVRQKDIDKVRGDNLCGVVVTAKVNQAPGTLPYDPLEGVEVKLEGTKWKTVTDSTGVFGFQVPAGDYTIICEKTGVGMVTKKAHVDKGALPTMLTIVLNPGQISADPAEFGPGGIKAPQAPGTAFVAFAQKAAAGTPAGSSSTPAGGYNMTTTQTYRQMIMLGGDPFSLGGGNATLPTSMPGDFRSTDFYTSMNIAANALMMLGGYTLGKPGFKELTSKPFWCAFNAGGTRLYVSTADRVVQVYDTANDNVLLTSIPVNGIITDLRLSLDGNNILATAMGAAPNVLMIDTRNNAPQRCITVPGMKSGSAGQPTASALNREGTRLFVTLAASGKGEVVAIDAFTSVPQAYVAVGSNPTGMELSPDGRFLYVVNSGSGDVSVIDAWSFTEMGRIRVGVSPQKVAVTPDGSRVFITNKGSDNVTVLNGMNQAPIATVPVGKGPVGVAVSPDGSKAFVGCTGTGNVSVLDASTGGILMSTSPLPNSTPWGICVRP
ncbi:MAG: YncE family protein [bacterium]|nr:YncE family protein [bacterium]